MTNDEIKNRWEELLQVKRFRPTRSKGTTEYKGASYARIPFDSDYSRVSMSAPFRRLQDKAQVFPLEKLDFSRTRLTHSVEVSGLARSIGVSIENILIEKKYLEETRIGHIPSILSVAGLIHDIGNPPFGHSGEATIQRFFTNYFKSKLNSKGLSDIEQADFINFDGNVQGLRLLLKLGLADDEYSYNLTMPTLASIIKYPKSSIDGNKDNYKEIGGIEFKKFGYFQSEKKRFDDINSSLKLNNHRHPLTYLLESADDIAYSVSDIEDGCKKGTISIDSIKKILKRKNFMSDDRCKSLLSHLKKVDASLSGRKLPSRTMILAQECRIKVQTLMILDIIEVFVDKQEDIFNGKFGSELLSVSKSAKLREFTKELAKSNFNDKEVLKNELIGENVISYLLENFISAVSSSKKEDPKTKEGKLYNLISSHYKFVMDKFDKYPNKKYKLYMLVTDYISGMTDTYALTIYRELKGMND